MLQGSWQGKLASGRGGGALRDVQMSRSTSAHASTKTESKADAMAPLEMVQSQPLSTSANADARAVACAVACDRALESINAHADPWPDTSQEPEAATMALAYASATPVAISSTKPSWAMRLGSQKALSTLAVVAAQHQTGQPVCRLQVDQLVRLADIG